MAMGGREAAPRRQSWHHSWHDAGRRSAMSDILDVATAAAARPGADPRSVLADVVTLAAFVAELDLPERDWLARMGSGPC